MTPMSSIGLTDALPATRRRTLPTDVVAMLAGLPAAAVARIGRAWRTHLEIRHLMAMDDRMLKDLGLTRGQVPFAIRTGADRPASR